MGWEPNRPDEPQMLDAFRNFDSNTFVKFLLEHSGLSREEKIGVAKDGRALFRLF